MRKISNLHYHPTALPAEQAEPLDGRPTVIRTAAPLPSRSLSVIDERLSEEIETMKRWIDLTAASLGADPILRARHAGELQTLQMVSRTAAQLAAIIAAADKGDAIDRIPLPELRARMQRRPITAMFDSKH